MQPSASYPTPLKARQMAGEVIKKIRQIVDFSIFIF